ncbi:efflux RND transporter periplasmic adaptor subunit [Synergistaceae bacterium OttesenSCG-928-I11]|nr:efflux RND transporter periplasmic adaptor subunit [Synergistaceae bacterium OttesenSCG-928-I11]
MKKKTVAILVLLVAICGAAYWFWQKEKNKDDGTIKLFGNVEIREVLLSFRIGGRLDTLRFEEGVRVASGDMLAGIDNTPYAIGVKEANAALLAAQANLEKLRHGYQDEDIRAAQAERDQVAVSLRNAETNYQRFRELYDQNVVAQKEFDDVASARDQLRAQLAAAESQLHRLRGGYRPEDIKAAEAQVDVAQSQLDAAYTSLNDTEIYAPDDGTILTRIAEPGSVVGAGQPVYSMMLARPIQVRAYVTEPQLGHVRLGMKGLVYIDSHPDEPIEGTINFIATSAEFTPKQVQTEDMRSDLVYRIRLLIPDNPQDRLKNGMPVTVVLVPEEE